jgi:hypothetical protein
MNERIRELALQAGYEVDMFGVGHWDMPECKKFAELIVRECIECTKEWYEARIADSARDYSRGYVHGCDEAIAEMKKRFGVEE